MKKILYTLSALILTGVSFAQQNLPADTIKTQNLQEVIVVGNAPDSYQKDSKALGSLDDYLEKSNAVDMVKRGAYAWEPMLNGMTSERSVITVDGMRIYQACTDKMDPITSYVENTNLSRAYISHGASGSEFGGSVAGSIDLKRRKGSFDNSGWNGSLFAGYESNNQQKISGGLLKHATNRFFTDLDLTFRDAENYKDGDKNTILYSQFTKLNLSNITGIKLSENQQVEMSLIYDKATNVGYPALTMDVSLAEALIGSLQYNRYNLNRAVDLWESKIYFNKITHIMDDSPRPDVPIRMDMPGKTSTTGAYSKIKGSKENHQYQLTWSGHYNNSFAEMTMYPANPEEKEMYMLTWPDVNTVFTGLFLEDKWKLNDDFNLKLTAGASLHHNYIENEMALSTLRIFYPEMEDSQTRFLKSVSTDILFHKNKLKHSLSLGYSDRAPSVSEGYGFYLFNSFDGWDYVGNPFLKNEKSLNMGFSTTYLDPLFIGTFRANYFHMIDYIIGKPGEDLLPMTIGANGVKTYLQLPNASIFNTELELSLFPARYWEITGKASYRLGQDMDKNPLPLIQPFSYGLDLRYEKNKYFAEASILGSSAHHNYSAEFGESRKDAYWIVNAAVSRSFNIYKQEATVKLGVENLFNRYYSTFADWNNIPRMGRNLFINLIYRF